MRFPRQIHAPLHLARNQVPRQHYCYLPLLLATARTERVGQYPNRGTVALLQHLCR